MRNRISKAYKGYVVRFVRLVDEGFRKDMRGNFRDLWRRRRGLEWRYGITNVKVCLGMVEPLIFTIFMAGIGGHFR